MVQYFGFKGNILYKGEKYVITCMNLKHIKYLNNCGNFAVVLEGNNKKYVLVAAPYFLKIKGIGICKNLSLEAIKYTVDNNYQLLYYSDDGPYIWTLDANEILNDFNNNILKEEAILHRNQRKIDLVPLQKYGASNVVSTRQPSANQIETYLNNLFQIVDSSIIYTGNKSAIIGNRKPDWIVHLQKKVILYMGLHVHSEQDIIQEVKDYNNFGYQVYIIRSDEYSNKDMNSWKDEIIKKRIKLFINEKSTQNQIEIDKQFPIKKIIPVIKIKNNQTNLNVFL